MRKMLIGLSVIASLLLFAFIGNETIVNVPTRFLMDTTQVKATIYKPSVGSHTADGFKIDKKNAGMHRLIAVSHDLKKRYPFGTRVLVLGAGELEGVYTVKDIMGKQWKNKIDILVDQDYPLVRYNKVLLIKISDEFFNQI